MDRRGFLAVAVSALPCLGGCLSTPGATVGTGDCPSDAATASDLAVGTVRGPKRGEADRITISTTEDEDDIEYIAANDTVRLSVSGGDTTTDEGPGSEAVPFEAWARSESLTAGGRAAARAANQALCTDEVVLDSTRGRPGEPAAFVRLTIVVDGTGTIVDGTGVTFERLRHATPATVAVTYAFEGRTFEMAVPIYVRYRVLSQETVATRVGPP